MFLKLNLKKAEKLHFRYKPKDPPILVPRLVFMSKKAIAYKVYPGDSARMFPGFQTVIFVNPDLYDQWVKDHASVKFEDVLIDPQNPVKYYGDGIINDIRSTYNVPNDKLQRWYQTCDPMQLARITAEEGRDITRQLE